MIGINQYFGWYPWVADFNLLHPFLLQMRDNYPDKALVMTEFGAEARPELTDSPAGHARAATPSSGCTWSAT